MALPRWGIVTTADAPAPLLICHAAHHLAAGASEVHLYLDRPPLPAEMPVVAHLAALPGCRVTVTDDAYWRTRLRRRPHLHQVRQTRNATTALAGCGADFLIHLDVDEYLWQWEPLGPELALVPKGSYLKIGNVERIFAAADDGDAVFTPTFRLPETLFADGAGAEDSLAPNGLTGHSAGKAAAPRGFGYTFGIHRPRFPGRGAPRYPRHRLSEAATILHFDGFTRRDWIFKLLRKGEVLVANPESPASAARLRQVAALMEEGGDVAAAVALHDRLKQLSPEREAALRDRGRLADVVFDPAEAVRRVVPGLDLDLSAAAYDRWLAETRRDVFARFGLVP